MRETLEKSSQLDSYWRKESLGKLAEQITKGTTPTTAGFTYLNSGIPFIKVENIGKNGINLQSVTQFIGDDAHEVLKRSQLQDGDVLFSIAGTIGKTALVNRGHLPANTNQAVAIIRGISSIFDPRLLKYQLQAGAVDIQKTNARGGAMNNISLADLKSLNVFVPPLAEQKVIADKLDQLLAQVESTKARLDRIPDILKRFRQSVLAAAVSGKLTEDWRMHNSGTSVSKLIDHCHGQITDKKSLRLAEKEFRPDEVSKVLPETWQWVRLAKISEVVSGIAKGSKTKEETVTLPYLRVANVQRGFLDLDEIKEISVPTSKAEKIKLKFGDVLFNEGGDIDKLGRGWIWEGQVADCIHQNHVFRARCYSSDIEAKFISHYGNTEGKEYFLREGTQSVNLANINKTTLSLLPIPLPPSEEQTEIIRQVEHIFTYVDKVEQQVNQAQERVNKLTQSILAKAFRGELTEQWRKDNPDLISGDNSAEALLAKIKVEREAAKPKKKTRKKA